MSRYIKVLEEQFDTLLQSVKGWRKMTVGRELVYYYILKKNPDIIIKVYSSIKRGNEVGRACGKDAIRVCAVDRKRDKGLVKSARVYRVPNWEDRVQARVIKAIELAIRRYEANAARAAQKAS